MRRFIRQLVLAVAVLAACVLLTAGAAAAGKEKTWEDYYREGMEQAEARKYGLAAELFTKAIELNPDNPELYILRGLSYGLNHGDKEGVISVSPDENRALSFSDFQKAYSLDPDNKELRREIEDAQETVREYIEAIETVTASGEEPGQALASFDDLSAYEEPTEYDHRNEWFYDDGRLRGFILYDSLNRKIYEEQYPYYSADFQGGRKITKRFYHFWDSVSYPCTGIEITYSDELVEGEMVKQKNYAVYEYDARGFLTRSASYLADGTLVYERIYPTAGQGGASR